MNAPGITYFSIDGAPHQFFRCEPFRATLSTKACGDRFRQAQTAKGADGERFEKCRSCPIGAAHAGVQHVYRSPIFGLSICPRSRRWASRLIHGRLGVGAYNRTLEVVKGRNAKGRPPELVLEPRRIALTLNGERIELRDALTHDTVEMVVAVLRTVPGRIIFTRARPNAPAISTVELARRFNPPTRAPLSEAEQRRRKRATERRKREMAEALAVAAE
jgi:hypothetical protein